MPSNRTVAQPSIVRDVTDESTRALARAAYEARKQSIQALEDQKGELKDALDNQNAILAEAKAEARNLQRQIDEIDERIADLKANG